MWHAKGGTGVNQPLACAQQFEQLLGGIAVKVRTENLCCIEELWQYRRAERPAHMIHYDLESANTAIESHSPDSLS